MTIAQIQKWAIQATTSDLFAVCESLELIRRVREGWAKADAAPAVEKKPRKKRTKKIGMPVEAGL